MTRHPLHSVKARKENSKPTAPTRETRFLPELETVVTSLLGPAGSRSLVEFRTRCCEPFARDLIPYPRRFRPVLHRPGCKDRGLVHLRTSDDGKHWITPLIAGVSRKASTTFAPSGGAEIERTFGKGDYFHAEYHGHSRTDPDASRALF